MSIKKNVIANFIGRGWQILLSVAVVPIYIKLIGYESYGLIGIFTSLLAICTLLDFGLIGALGREFSKVKSSSNQKENLLDILKTVETIYIVISFSACLLIIFVSYPIAYYWIQSSLYSPDQLQKSINLMALAIGIQLPVNLYISGLMSLENQVLSNILSVITTTFRVFSTILILWLIDASIDTFYILQIVGSLFQFFIFRTALRKIIKQKNYLYDGRLNFNKLKNLWSYSKNLGLVSILLSLLSQIDKILLSKIVPLKIFGFYVIANSIVQLIYFFPAPIAEAANPRLTQYVADNNYSSIRELFLTTSSLIAGITFPITATLIFFSKEILELWLHDVKLVAEIWPVVSILTLAISINVMANTLDGLQMAYGWLKPAQIARLVALVVVIPLMSLLVLSYGIIGAAITWLLIFSLYIIFIPNYVFKKIKIDCLGDWMKAWIPTMLINLTVSFVLKLIYIESDSTIVKILEIGCFLFLNIVTTIIFNKNLKNTFINMRY